MCHSSHWCHLDLARIRLYQILSKCSVSSSNSNSCGETRKDHCCSDLANLFLIKSGRDAVLESSRCDTECLSSPDWFDIDQSSSVLTNSITFTIILPYWRMLLFLTVFFTCRRSLKTKPVTEFTGNSQILITSYLRKDQLNYYSNDIFVYLYSSESAFLVPSS